jgi:hypothetical protein
MKKFGTVLVILIACLTFKAEAQDFPRDSLTQKIDFVGVVPAPGLTKSEAFDRALVVLHRMYKQADTKISVKDKDNGIIVVNGFTQLMLKLKNGTMMPVNELVLYKLTIAFKNGKYRYEFTDFLQNRAGTPNHIEKWIEHNVPGDHFYSADDHIQENLTFLYNDVQKRISELKTGMLGDKTIEKQDW